MRRARRIVFVGTTLMILVMSSAAAHAALRLVPLQYRTIQSAVNASNPGDTVWIMDGEYRENVHVDVDRLSIRGTCLGAGSSAVIDGATGGDVFHIDAVDVSMRCLTLRHGATGIHADGGVTVLDVRIISSGGNGIYIGSDDGFRIRNVEIVGTSSTGIHVDRGFNGVIADTNVRGSDGDCYYLDFVDGLEFFRNQGLGCTGYALQAYGDTMRIHENTFRHNSAGVYLGSDGNTVTMNTIIDSANYDDGLFVDGNDNTIESNEVNHCFYDCLSAWGDGVVIRNNVLIDANDDYCLDLYGNDMVVVGNKCLGQHFSGIDLLGHGAEIRDNTIAGAQYTPIWVRGDDAAVIGNKVSGGYDGVYVTGANVFVEANDVSGTTFWPIDVWGDDPRVIGNQVSLGYTESIFVSCYESCGLAEIRDNVVNGAGSGGGFCGLFVRSGPGTVISGNSVRHAQGYGLELHCDECTISSNEAIENGGYDGFRAGFYIGGDGSTLSENRASRNTGPGFRIAGNANTLDGNEANLNSLEGFRIDTGTSNNILNRNVAERNHAEGIDNKGDATELSSNFSSSNRTDCTDDGSMATNLGNTCGDASNFTLGSSID